MNSGASPFQNLSAVILGLRAAVAAWGGRRWLDVALVWLVHRRLGEILRRMEGMAARFQAGRLRPAGVRKPRAPGGKPAVRGKRLWPGSFGWLVRRAGWEAAGFGCQLRAVLETPEMVALLTACPQAVRVLRPLCRALAIETAILRPAVKAAPVRVRPDTPDQPVSRWARGFVGRKWALIR